MSNKTLTLAEKIETMMAPTIYIKPIGRDLGPYEAGYMKGFADTRQAAARLAREHDQPEQPADAAKEKR